MRTANEQSADDTQRNKTLTSNHRIVLHKQEDQSVDTSALLQSDQKYLTLKTTSDQWT